MEVNETFAHGPKNARRTFRVIAARRLTGTFSVRYVVADVTTGETLIAYAHTGSRLTWNARLYHGPESFSTEQRDKERARRDALATRLASGHPFAESIATANVCGTCGAHRDYHV